MIRLIAYLATPGGLTGAPRRLLTLASVLKKEGIQTCIATQSGSALIQAAEAEGHKTAPMDAPGVLAVRQGALFGGGSWFRLRIVVDLLRQNWRFFRCVRGRRGHAVWIRGSKGIAFVALGSVLSGRPLIWDVDYELPSRGVVRWLHRLGLWASKVLVFQYYAAPDAIFGRELASRYRDKFWAIIPGIDLQVIELFRAQREQREKSNVDPFVILQVGTICDRKNQGVIMEAMRILKQHGVQSRIELWLAYDEFQDRRLLDQTKEFGLEQDVKLLGWRDDIKDLMVQADVLVMPSRDEGVPNAVQEAMGIGLPVLVSEAGGMPEIVRDGETGWVLGMNDPQTWAERIRWCQQNPDLADRVGRNAASYAFDHFGTEAWGKEYGRVVQEVTDRSTVGKHN